ncbi:MAG: hypothetical protein D6707_03915, partial [Bacteroidetes bacterium]
MAKMNTTNYLSLSNNLFSYFSNSIKKYGLFLLLFMGVLSGECQVQKGNDIEGMATDDSFGYSVSMPDANTIAIGAPWNDGNGTDAGHVRVYTWNGSNWVQKGTDINGEAANDLSG